MVLACARMPSVAGGLTSLNLAVTKGIFNLNSTAAETLLPCVKPNDVDEELWAVREHVWRKAVDLNRDREYRRPRIALLLQTLFLLLRFT